MVKLLRIAVIGDTHGSKRSLRKISSTFSEVDLFVHTGDHWQDGIFLQQEMGIQVFTVKGNCDYGDYPLEKCFELKGKKFFLTHGHCYGVKHGLGIIAQRAQQLKADYCIFGHTHITQLEIINGIMYINPGSLTNPRGKDLYAGILLEMSNEGILKHQFIAGG